MLQPSPVLYRKVQSLCGLHIEETEPVKHHGITVAYHAVVDLIRLNPKPVEIKLNLRFLKLDKLYLKGKSRRYYPQGIYNPYQPLRTGNL